MSPIKRMPSCSNPSGGARRCRARSSRQSTTTSATRWPGCRCSDVTLLVVVSGLISGMNAHEGNCVQGIDPLNEDVDPPLRSSCALAMDRSLGAGIATRLTGTLALALVALLMAAVPVSRAQEARQGARLLRDRNIDVSRAGAAQLPRSEGDQ